MSARTPEEIARDIRFNVPWITSPSGAQHDRPDWDAMEQLIIAAIRDAYERAAKIVEDWPDFRQWNADDCAKAIRALKSEE